jgi:hypothetical protein
MHSVKGQGGVAVALAVVLGFQAAPCCSAFTRLVPCATGVNLLRLQCCSLSRREAVLALPGAVRLLRRPPAAAQMDAVAASKPVGYRATTLLVGGQTIPVAQWYPLADEGEEAATFINTGPPYRYRINIANLFRAFLGFKPPIPSPEVRNGGASAVRRDAPPAQGESKGGIVFAHGLLGSRFDMATLCEQLAREGFVVSSADFAESISGSFAPNENTGRGAIIEAEMELLRRDFGATTFGIFGHSAGGGSASMAPGPFLLGRCAIAGARPYGGRDPFYIIASAGDGVIPIDRIRAAVRPDMPVASHAGQLDWEKSTSGALLINSPVTDGSRYMPSHISFLDAEANAALVRVLSPLLPLAKLLRLPTLDFDVYVQRIDAESTAAAVRPSIIEFFLRR